MSDTQKAQPCTSDRNQRKYCRHYNQRTGLCANPPATHAPEPVTRTQEADTGERTGA